MKNKIVDSLNSKSKKRGIAFSEAKRLRKTRNFDTCPQPIHEMKLATAITVAPIVYIFWNESGKALYVGFSSKGIGRPFASGHQANKALLSSAAIEIKTYASTLDAMKAEQYLIVSLRPKYNSKKYKPLSKETAQHMRGIGSIEGTDLRKQSDVWPSDINFQIN